LKTQSLHLAEYSGCCSGKPMGGGVIFVPGLLVCLKLETLTGCLGGSAINERPMINTKRMKWVLSVDTIQFSLTGVGRYIQELARQLILRPDLDIAFMQGARLLKDLPEMSMAHAGRRRLRDALSGFSLPVEIYRCLNRATRVHALRGFEQSLFHGTNDYVPAFGGKSIVTRP